MVDLLDKYQAHARVIVSAYGPKRVQAYANIGADLMYFVPVDKKEELDGYIKMGLKPERIIGFSGFDFPKKHLLDAYHAYGIKTLCDLQLDGRLMPYQLHKKMYQSVIAQGIPFVNTEWYAYVTNMFG